MKLTADIYRFDWTEGRSKRIACICDVPNTAKMAVLLADWLDYHGIDGESRHLYSCQWGFQATDYSTLTEHKKGQK